MEKIIQVFVLTLSLVATLFGNPAFQQKFYRNSNPTDLKDYSTSEPSENVMVYSKMEPFLEDNFLNIPDYTSVKNRSADETEVVQIGDTHHNIESGEPNNAAYRSIPVPDQQAALSYSRPVQLSMPLKMPLAISRFVPIPMPQAFPIVMEHQLPVQKPIPIVLSRPVPITYPLGLPPRLSFPGYGGYGYPYRPSVRLGRSKQNADKMEE